MTSSAEQDIQHTNFRKYLPDLDTPRFQAIAQNDAYGHAKELLEHHRPPWLYGLYVHWRELFEEPFKGVTSDGMLPLTHSVSPPFSPLNYSTRVRSKAGAMWI